MNTRVIGVTGLVLVFVGLVGIVVTSLVLGTLNIREGVTPQVEQTPTPRWFGPPGIDSDERFSSAGERIYLTGIGELGMIPREAGTRRGEMMADGGCVTCHGVDGQGGELRWMMGQRISVPDIRYEVLTAPQHGWSEEDIGRAIRDGVDPDGEQLDRAMPRWAMTDSELDDVIEYLRELSE